MVKMWKRHQWGVAAKHSLCCKGVDPLLQVPSSTCKYKKCQVLSEGKLTFKLDHALVYGEVSMRLVYDLKSLVEIVDEEPHFVAEIWILKK